MAVYGDNKVWFFDIIGGGIAKRFFQEVKFEIYSCMFLSEDDAWVAGADGNIACFTLANVPSATIKFKPFKQPINAMALSHDRTFVTCAGQAGMAAAVDMSGNVVRTFFEDMKPKTPWGLRATLSQVTDDETIHLYLFDWKRLSKRTIRDLEEHIQPIDVRTCAHAPNLPLLALGSSEGTVHLIDSRDGQILQEIDATAGIANSICGLEFLSDHELAAVSTDGDAKFYSAKVS